MKRKNLLYHGLKLKGRIPEVKVLTQDKEVALKALFQALRGAAIHPARVSLAWRQEGGRFLYARGEGEVQTLTEMELYEKEALFMDLFFMRPDISVLIRSRPPHVEALASVRNLRSLGPSLDDAAQVIGSRIVISAEDKTKRIRRALRKHQACLVRAGSDSYALAMGRTLDQALAATLILDKSALAYVEGCLLGGAKPLNPLMAKLYRMAYLSYYQKQDQALLSQTADDIPRSIPKEEMVLRQAILDTSLDLVRENLVQGTWGNISVRLDEDHMLVTPSGLAYDRLTPYDLVRVDLKTLAYEAWIKPTSEARLHAAIYKAFPDMTWLIHSHPLQSSVFAACQQAIPVLHGQDREWLGDRTAFSPRRLSGTSALASAVVKALSRSQSKVCVMGSHGIMVAGTSQEEALERCRATERAARRYLDSKVRELRG